MATGLTPDQMKQFVREHFEEFVNKRNLGHPQEYDPGLLRRGK
jgi:hypothetical protein